MGWTGIQVEHCVRVRVCVCVCVHVYTGRCAYVCLQDVYTEVGSSHSPWCIIENTMGAGPAIPTGLFSDGNWPSGFLSQNLQQETPLQLQPSPPFSCLRPRD